MNVVSASAESEKISSAESEKISSEIQELKELALFYIYNK